MPAIDLKMLFGGAANMKHAGAKRKGSIDAGVTIGDPAWFGAHFKLIREQPNSTAYLSLAPTRQ